MTEHQEKLLIEKAKNGDVRSFEELVKLHFRKLNAFALSITRGDRAIAEDILQEALMMAFMYIKNFKGDASFSSWLWRIVKNEFLKYMQRAKTAPLQSLEDMPENVAGTSKSAEKTVIIEERKKNLRKMIGELSPQDSEVLTLIDLQQLSYEEVSDLLGLGVNAVKSRVLRARKRLTEIILNNKKLFL